MIISLENKTGSQQNTRGEREREVSYILHERARQYYWQGASPLSIKTFSGGRALYTLGKGYYAVDETNYLVVNHDQPYTIAIEANEPVESFCLFFEPGLAEEVQRSLETPAWKLLDEPVGGEKRELSFVERTYQHDQHLTPLLWQIRNGIMQQPSSSLWLEEQFQSIVQRLLEIQRNVHQEIEALPALRASTREELYRRMHRAREYINACYDTPVTLFQLAEIAELSPTHFLRSFKQTFQQSPHQYLIKTRLERAQHLLRESRLSVTEICFVVGFESCGSFSWLFQRKVGCSPSLYRLQHQTETISGPELVEKR